MTVILDTFTVTRVYETKVIVMKRLRGHRFTYSVILCTLSLISVAFFTMILSIQMNNDLPFVNFVFLGQILIVLSMVVFAYLTVTGYLERSKLKMRASLLLAIVPLFNPLFFLGNLLFFRDDK